MNQREKIERVKEFRLIDDVFFEVFASDIPACQEILRLSKAAKEICMVVR